MTPRFDTATIIGVGLLGGSLGLALKARGLCGTVRGVGHRQVSLDKALDVGAIDELYLDAQEASKGADLIVICTPAALVPAKLDEILPVCGEATVVTDVASTKAQICTHVRETWPKPLRFVGSHPMAGSEKYGPEHANVDLYVGSVTIVEPNDGMAPDAHARVRDLWRGVGANVVEVDPRQHDVIMARTSHIPHIVSSCLARLVERKANVRSLIGNGFRDMTRIAEGRPEIWRDICLTNRDAILEGLQALTGSLTDVHGQIAEGDPDALAEFFQFGQAARREVLGE